jgi:hypothetical protein
MSILKIHLHSSHIKVHIFEGNQNWSEEDAKFWNFDSNNKYCLFRVSH